MHLLIMRQVHDCNLTVIPAADADSGQSRTRIQGGLRIDGLEGLPAVSRVTRQIPWLRVFVEGVVSSASRQRACRKRQLSLRQASGISRQTAGAAERSVVGTEGLAHCEHFPFVSTTDRASQAEVAEGLARAEVLFFEILGFGGVDNEVDRGNCFLPS